MKFNPVMSEDFPVETGLRQGDVLSSIHFNIALQSLVRKIQKYSEGLKTGGKTMVMAAYADDK